MGQLISFGQQLQQTQQSVAQAIANEQLLVQQAQQQQQAQQTQQITEPPVTPMEVETPALEHIVP